MMRHLTKSDNHNLLKLKDFHNFSIQGIAKPLAMNYATSLRRADLGARIKIYVKQWYTGCSTKYCDFPAPLF